VVEWPEKAAGLPVPDLAVHLGHAAVGRVVSLRAGSNRGAGWLEPLAV
jgi:hypothetical protein